MAFYKNFYNSRSVLSKCNNNYEKRVVVCFSLYFIDVWLDKCCNCVVYNGLFCLTKKHLVIVIIWIMIGVVYVVLFHQIFDMIQSLLWFRCRIFCMDVSLVLTCSFGFRSKHFDFLQTFAQCFCPTIIALSNICWTCDSWSDDEMLPQLRHRVCLGRLFMTLLWLLCLWLYFAEFWVDRCCGYVACNGLLRSHCLWLTVFADVSTIRNWLCISVSILTANSIASCVSRFSL